MPSERDKASENPYEPPGPQHQAPGPQRSETLAKAWQYTGLAMVSGVVMISLWMIAIAAISTVEVKFSALHYFVIAVSGIGGAVAFFIAMRLVILSLKISLWKIRSLN